MRIALVLIFVKNEGLTRIVPGIKLFTRKKNLVFKLGGSQQFKNNWFSWLVLTSQISKISILFLENYVFTSF